MIFRRSIRLVSLFAFVVFSSPFLGHLVSAYSTGAGTCKVEEMQSLGHGVAPLQGNGGYTMTATPSGGGNFKIALNGKSMKGILMYTMDSTKNRVGTFSGLPSNLQIKDCGGSGKSTITHSNPAPKTMPMSLNWSSGGPTSGNITVRAIVVQSFNQWYLLPEFNFDLAATTAVGPSQDATTTSDSTTPTEDNKFFIVAFFTNYTLFAIVMSITTFLYISSAAVEGLLKRQNTKARSYAKSVNGFGPSSIE